MGTASKQPTKKEVKVAPPRKCSRCPVCNKIVADLSKHIATTDCK